VTGVTINMHGLAALNQRMSALPKDVQTKLGQQANRVGAAVIAKKAKELAPVSNQAEGSIRTRHTKSGTTRQEVHKKIVNSIKVRKTKTTTPTQVQNSIAVETYTATYVELGSIHNTPNPFLRNAFTQAQPDAIAAIAKSLGKKLTRLNV
jgi:HK97 gp10 family phage protein